MKSNKLFYIKECYLKLPDDFDGTCGNALMLLAQKRLEQEECGRINKEDEQIDSYSNLMTRDDIACSISYSLLKQSEDGTKWVNIK